jgi:hypothetical protein
MYMRRLLEAVKDIKKTVQNQKKSAHGDYESAEEKKAPKEIRAEIRFNEQTITEARTEQDRAYTNQRSIKHATWAAFMAASIYAALAACQLHELQTATKATQQAAGAADSAAVTAKEALVRGQRPWVGPEKEPTVILNESKDGIQSIIVVPIRNNGPSPALHLGYYIEPMEIGSSLNPIEEKSKSFCQMAEIEIVTTDHLPGQNFGFYILPNEIERLFDKRAWSPEKPFNAVVGCIAYTDQFHDTPIHSVVHHTSFCFHSYIPIVPKQPPPQLVGCNFAQSID